MMTTNPAIRSAQLRDERTVYYTQNDVEVIREQIIQGESMKRRWLVLGLILATAGLAVTIALLSSSYALYARTEASNEQLTQQNAATTRRSNEVQQALDGLRERDAQQESAKAEALALEQKVLSGVPGNTDVSSVQGAKLAKAIYQLGGHVETASKPPDKLFRNWKLNADAQTEYYTVVGGFVDGKWVIYSNLVARKQSAKTTSSNAGQN
jgi:cell division protein FtsB